MRGGRQTVIRAAVGAICLAALLAACGSDGSDGPSAQDRAAGREWMASMQQTCDGQPGFDEFLSSHPEPTAQDWAQFLPTQVEMVRSQRTCVAGSDAPAFLDDELASFDTAMARVQRDLQDATTAAQAGDLETMDASITTMREEHLPKVTAVEHRVGKAIGQKAGG